MNKILFTLPLLLALLIISGCTAPTQEKTTTTSPPAETAPPQVTPTPTAQTTTADNTTPGLVDEGDLAELEAELSALEEDLNNLNETDSLNLLDV